MSCTISYDNRETCTNVVPSSCVPYTGYLSDAVKTSEEFEECKPNINDVFKALQKLIDQIKASLGDNKNLDKLCLDFDPETVTQEELNQIYITELCNLKTLIPDAETGIDPSTILLAIDLLCLQDPSCEPQETYTLIQVLTKLITGYCNLLARVTAIENILNI